MSRNFLQVFEAKTYDQEGAKNPLFKRVKRLRSGGLRFFSVLGVLVGSGALGWLLFGPALRLTTLEINGATTLNKNELESAVESELGKHTWGLPRSNRWFLSEKNIEARLLTDFPLQSVKLFVAGHTLRLTVVEDVTVIALRSGETIGFLDRTGVILRLADPLEIVAIRTRLGDVTPSAAEQADLPAIPVSLPVIHTANPLSLEVGQKIFTPLVMENLITMDEGLKRRDISVKEYLIDDVKEPWFRIVSDLPYEIYFDAEHDIEQQLTTLQAVMKEYTETPPLHYLDVRFGERVFVR